MVLMVLRVRRGCQTNASEPKQPPTTYRVAATSKSNGVKFATTLPSKRMLKVLFHAFSFFHT